MEKVFEAAKVAPRRFNPVSRWSLVLNALLILTLVHLYRYPGLPQNQATQPLPQAPCRSLLPPLLARSPPGVHRLELAHVFEKLDAALAKHYADSGSDSVSVAVVSSNGSLYEGFWGPLRANETDDDKRGVLDRHSIYRVASISKLFTALETLILRNRGVLNLDDPVKKVIPELTYHTDYGPITYRQVMSHMSGLSRSSQPDDATGWPGSLEPAVDGSRYPTHEQFMHAIESSRPVAPPYTFPVYSNVGFQLLGNAIIAANRLVEGSAAPPTHAELMHRDVFAPLGLNGSSFRTTPENRAHVVIPSVKPEEIDDDFGDTSNPSGGQLSSLSDLVKVMQTFIDPTRSESVLPAITMREWLRPLNPWYDDFTEVGAPWEIYKAKDSYGRVQRLYQKFGELTGYHSGFTINPTSSYGIIVLTTGPQSQTLPLINIMFEHVQPVFDAILEADTRDLLVGSWISDHGENNVIIEIEGGSLYLTRYMLNGTDVLAVMQDPVRYNKLPLWSTSEKEYRVATPAPYTGCFFSWLTLDAHGYINGTSVNLLELVGDGDDPVLYIPALDMKLRRSQ